MISAVGFFSAKLVLFIAFFPFLVRAEAEGSTRMSFDGETFGWDHGHLAEKTYIFTNIHWWESLDHQMTSIVSLLTLARNTSSIAVIPSLPSRKAQKSSNKSLLGDYFDLGEVSKVQPAITFSGFLETDDYERLRREKTGSIPFPKDSQEEYEAKLNVFGKLRDTAVRLQMPPVDPEGTSQKCNSFSGTMHVSSDGKRRYVFLDRIHFLHFCIERFMPWWYDVRHRIAPKQPYFVVAEQFLSDKTAPISAIHISDVMDSQKVRGEEEIERYARQIVDALRKNQAIGGSMYLIHSKHTRNVQKVVDLLGEEFDRISNCSHLFSCGESVPAEIFKKSLSGTEHKALFSGSVGLRMLEWALSSKVDLFVGNVHSPYSRNVCLHRKTHGKKYAILKGFGELRKIWSWNL